MTETKVLIEALRILARDIQSGDGVANAAIAEAADRLEKQQEPGRLLRRGQPDEPRFAQRAFEVGLELQVQGAVVVG